MVLEDIRNIKSDKAEFRKFGITIGVVSGILGGVLLWRGGDYYLYLFVFSVLFIFSGVFRPALLRPVHKVWMSLAVTLGWIMTRIILSVLFYLVFTPIGVLVRLFGRDFLDLKFDKDADSYWIPREKVKFEKSDHEKQF